MRGYELDKAKLVVRGKCRDTRRLVKRLLKRHKYPPEGMEDAVQTVMTPVSYTHLELSETILGCHLVLILLTDHGLR